jgi:hypothetical protein
VGRGESLHPTKKTPRADGKGGREQALGLLTTLQKTIALGRLGSRPMAHGALGFNGLLTGRGPFRVG